MCDRQSTPVLSFKLARMSQGAHQPAGFPESPYARILLEALKTAQFGNNPEVEQCLLQMLDSLANHQYAELLKSWGELPTVYQKVTGEPPRSGADDV